METPINRAPSTNPETGGRLSSICIAVRRVVHRVPESLIALLARFSIAAVFWNSGQTKVEGLALNIVDGTVQLGMPKLAESAVDLFRDEYRLPLLDPTTAAVLATVAEHVFPIMLLVGLATRFGAFALLVMTAVIQLFVYPGAYATHGVWAAVLLWLIVRGPGAISLDHLVMRWFESSKNTK